MREVSIRIRLARDPNSNEWVATSPDVQGLRERGDSEAALIAGLHVTVARMLVKKGVTQESEDVKVTLVTTLE